MTRSIKKVLLCMLIVLLCFTTFISVGLINVSAETTTKAKITGVALRTVNDENGKFGIKFKAEIIENYIETAKYGMYIVPADLKDNTESYATVMGASFKQENNVYTYQCALTDILAANISRPFVAKPFVIEDGFKI